MHPQSNHLSKSDIERLIHNADQAIDALFPQDEEQVRDMESMLGTTPCQLPENLRDARAVLNRIERKLEEEREPSDFGKLLSYLRSKKRLSTDDLAKKTDLDVEDLLEIESSSENVASPMTVVVLAEFFNLDPQKVQQVAGLSRKADEGIFDRSLGIAACADPVLDQLSREELKALGVLVKRLK